MAETVDVAPVHKKSCVQLFAIVITLLDDGTISGEMVTNMGPVKWTGEKLKTKKKG